MIPIRDHIARAATAATLVLGTVLVGLSTPAATVEPRDTTVTAAAAVSPADLGWQ
ncbi:hypothetical protein ABZY09_07315 [Streptomyces sp. NPDC002928]|uniref:hypothetical protein n=1 Tax=Streptomyces sp. NPDC002928 TaxID=3154440 RepID=UPI0033A64754